jgi:hypothetical protein
METVPLLSRYFNGILEPRIGRLALLPTKLKLGQIKQPAPTT